MTEQEVCCNGLADDQARSACKAKIVQVSNPDAEDTRVNRETYACVDRHFSCDAATGTATAESAQEILDCIQSLDP